MRVEIYHQNGQMSVSYVEPNGAAAAAIGLTFSSGDTPRSVRVKSLAAALVAELQAGAAEQPWAVSDFATAIAATQEAMAYGFAASNAPAPGAEPPAEQPPAEEPPAEPPA